MGIRFIPRNTIDVHGRDERTELSAASETSLAWQIAEARELNVAVKPNWSWLIPIIAMPSKKSPRSC